MACGAVARGARRQGLRLLLAWLSWALMPAALARAGEPLTAVERVAVLVAANDGGPGRATLRYTESDAHAVGKALRQVGGLASDAEIVVHRATPARIRAALKRAAARTAEAAQRGRRVELVFYYSGHSDETGLLLGERTLPYRELRRALEAVPADVHIAILDSCSSGAFTRAKGGTRRPPFLAGSAGEVSGHAFLTSSSEDETAQESDRIGGSFFTHFLVSGLRGAADRNGDRLVTLGEAYQFAFTETLAHTETTSVGAQHPAYEIALSGSGELVMTDLRRATGRLEIERAIRGRIRIRSSNGHLAAELASTGDETTVLALEPGRYTVTVDADRRLAQASVRVPETTPAVLKARDLVAVPREATTARGTTTSDEYVRVPVSIGFFPALSMAGKARPTIVGFGVAVLWSQVARVHGMSMATGADIVREEVRGVQWSGGASVVRGRLSGAQLTAGMNWVSEDARGAQLAGLANAADRAAGLQATFGGNYAGAMRGAQIGIVNVARRSASGAQLGVLNVGGNVRGAQLGLFNFARRSDASVGLLSITREGGVHADVWTSDTAAFNVGVRFDAKYTYSFLAMGFHPAGRGAGWQLGGGLGGHIPLRGPAALEIDIAAYAAFVDPAFRTALAHLATARLMLAWRLRPRVTLFGGPTFNLQHDDPTRVGSRLGYGWSTLQWVDTEGDDRLRVWPGFAAGIRF